MQQRQIFISYASQDREAARRIYDELCTAPGARPWLDQVDLLGGSRWDPAIRTAISESAAFILLLSSASTTKRGYVQREVRAALEVLESLPEDSVYLFPLRLDASEPHFRALADIEYIDMFPDWDAGIRRLRQALLVHLGIPLAKRVDRRIVRASDYRRPAVGQLPTVATYPHAALTAAAFEDGAVIGQSDGCLTQVDSNGAPLRSRRELGSGGVTAVASSGRQGLVVGTGAGEVLRLDDWSGEVTRLARLEARVRSVYERSDHTVVATCGTSKVTTIAGDGTTSELDAELQAFRIAPGITHDAAVIALVSENRGALLHVTPASLRSESIAPITALGLARSPVRAIYALGYPLQGGYLLDYSVVPPANGVEVTGTFLNTNAVEIYEDRVGEAFDPWINATPCQAICFSPDGALVAGGHEAGQVAIWDSATGHEVANALTGHAVSDLVFLGRSKLLAATTGGLHIFDLALIRHAVPLCYNCPDFRNCKSLRGSRTRLVILTWASTRRVRIH